MKYLVGVDLGGTNTKIGILDENCNILIQKSIETLSKNGPVDTFTRIWDSIKELLKNINLTENDIEIIGLGIPGPVKDNSIVKIAANFSWGNNFNAKELMENITKKEVIVENDVRAISIGELKFGAAKGYKNAIIIPIGTGIASGIIIDEKAISGLGAAGEFGHIVYDINGRNCGCGLKGCLETIVSANGIVNLAKDFLKENPKGILYNSFKDNLEKIEAHHIFINAKNNDETSLKIVDRFCEALAFGIGSLLNIFNPEIVILAGGLAKSYDIIIEGVKKYLPKYALKICIDDVKFAQSMLLDEAGIKGSASLTVK